ncbi:MAG: hypothetical protein P8Y97_16390 [Candidatus Lokiarchaeota archaeon]
MSEIIKTILEEFGPCATNEVLDYLRSNLIIEKGNLDFQEWTRRKVRYHLNKIVKNNKKLFKFRCNSGYKVRYGYTKFNYYLLEEPRYLKERGYLKRCMFCGIPIYIQETNVFHFKFDCKQYKPQDYFKMLKINDSWAIISRDFVYGVLDDLQSCELRLPDNNPNNSDKEIQSELWLINKKAREKGIIESDRLLSLKAEEYIA